MSKVIVAGSINMDVVARAKRHPAPGETITGTQLGFIPGGKGANQAVASAKLGSDTFLIGALGTDPFGDTLYAFLLHSGVDLSSVKRVKDAPTGTAIIVVSNDGENTIVVVPGANSTVATDDIESFTFEKGDILVSQFEIPPRTIETFFEAGRAKGTTNILNPAPAQHISSVLLRLTDILVLNETELEFLIGKGVSMENAREVCKEIRSFQEQIVVLTLGKEGAVAVVGDRFLRVLGIKVTAVDTTGAGDCFVGALASRLAAGFTIDNAIRFANQAAAISVQRFGAGPSMPTLEDIGGLAAAV